MAELHTVWKEGRVWKLQAPHGVLTFRTMWQAIDAADVAKGHTYGHHRRRHSPWSPLKGCRYCDEGKGLPGSVA